MNCDSDPTASLLEVRGLAKIFDERAGLFGARRRIEAVSDLSFSLHAGGALGIVGESGSGKTTTARIILGLETSSSGAITFAGRPLEPRPSLAERRARARQIQIVFQNPFLSLDPKQSAAGAIEEVLSFHGGLGRAARRARARELFEAVGLAPALAEARPRQLSGGQAQRVAIARALAAEPSLVVLDEAVSALDVSVQAQILNLLADLRERLGLSILFISHDLSVIYQICEHVLVMYRGRAVEYGPIEAVLSRPRHPYTQKLLASVPGPGVVWPTSIATDDPETGCRFRNRCPYAFARCAEEPPLASLAEDRAARCWLAIADPERMPP